MTRSKYEHMLERHVLPILGEYELAALRPRPCGRGTWACESSYLTTADDAYRMLRAIFITAVTDGHIVKSPCQVKGAGNARSSRAARGFQSRKSPPPSRLYQ